jgi:hypothetical protein
VLVTLGEDELYFTPPSRLCAMHARTRACVCACVQEVFSIASDFSDTEIKHLISFRNQYDIFLISCNSNPPKRRSGGR